MYRLLAIIAAFASPLLFPAALAFVFVFLASIVVPPLGMVVGIFSDVLYYTPGSGLPLGIVIGSASSLVAFIVHQFIKTRIMGT